MSKDDVVWAYRIFLGRDPESEETVNSIVNSGKSRRQMIRDIINSEEFSIKHVVR